MEALCENAQETFVSIPAEEGMTVFSRVSKKRDTEAGEGAHRPGSPARWRGRARISAYLAEQHVIKKSDPRYAAIDAAAFASKNLYNQVTYQMRQAFINTGVSLSYAELFHRVKHLDCYQLLPRKVSNSILIVIGKNWKSFKNGLAAYDEDPSKFTGRPKLPGYKHKEKGRNILIYDIQAIGKRAYKKTGNIVPSGLGIEIETKVKWEDLDQVRIVPRRATWSRSFTGKRKSRHRLIPT